MPDPSPATDAPTLTEQDGARLYAILGMAVDLARDVPALNQCLRDNWPLIDALALVRGDLWQALKQRTERHRAALLARDAKAA